MAPIAPLSDQEALELVRAAATVRANAYAPYSQFQVGAALLGSSGRVFVGCNVENASYGLSLCAERSAIVSAVAAGERTFRAIAVVGGSGQIATPCGACRQFMVEFSPEMEVLLAAPDALDVITRTTAAHLLPDYFVFRKGA